MPGKRFGYDTSEERTFAQARRSTTTGVLVSAITLPAALYRMPMQTDTIHPNPCVAHTMTISAQMTVLARRRTLVR